MTGYAIKHEDGTFETNKNGRISVWGNRWAAQLEVSDSNPGTVVRVTRGQFENDWSEKSSKQDGQDTWCRFGYQNSKVIIKA